MRDLPKRLHFKDGGYYRVFRNEWIFLSHHRSAALRRHRRMEHGLPMEGPEPSWTSMERYLMSRFRSAKTTSKLRKIDFNLTREEFDQLIKRANGYCEVSSIKFDLNTVVGSNRRPWAPSIDRISAGRSYSFSNCRLVCCVVNWAMSDWGQDVFWKMVRRARRPKLEDVPQ